MSNQNNLPTAPVQYEFQVPVPPYLIQKRVDKASPEILVMKSAQIPKGLAALRQGDMIIIAMAQRIDSDNKLLLQIGKMLLGGDEKTVYTGASILQAIQSLQRVVAGVAVESPGQTSPDIQAEGGPGGPG